MDPARPYQPCQSAGPTRPNGLRLCISVFVPYGLRHLCLSHSRSVPSPAILSARQAHQPTTIPFNRFHRFRRFGHRPSTPLACRVPVSRLALPPASPSLASESSLRSAPVRDGTVQQVPSMFARPSSQPKTERETAGGLALTDWSSQSTAPSSSSSSSSSWAITATAVCPAPPTPPPSLSTMPDSMHVGT